MSGTQDRIHNLMRDALGLADSLKAIDEELAEVTVRRDAVARRHSEALAAVVAAIQHPSSFSSSSWQSIHKPISSESKAPVKSVAIENLGPLSKLVLELVDAEPGRLWKSADFIDEVERLHEERFEEKVDRGKVTSTIYRLKGANLIENPKGTIHSVKYVRPVQQGIDPFAGSDDHEIDASGLFGPIEGGGAT